MENKLAERRRDDAWWLFKQAVNQAEMLYPMGAVTLTRRVARSLLKTALEFAIAEDTDGLAVEDVIRAQVRTSPNLGRLDTSKDRHDEKDH